MVNTTTHHRLWIIAIEHAFDVGHDLAWVVVGDLSAPACPDSLRAVHEHHRDDWDVPFGLDALVIVRHVLQDRIVVHVEQVSCQCATKQAESAFTKHIFKSRV